MPKVIITREAILQVIGEHKADSISAVYRSLGGSGNVSGSTAKKIRELVPDLAERMAANKPTANVAAAKKPVAKKTSKGGKYLLSEKNPFRVGSGYGLVFDIMSSRPEGLTRRELVELYAKASRKNLKRAGYDVAVVLSAKDSPTGPRHRSCADLFWVTREGDHVQLRTA